jgi:hypothetical protein
MTTFRKLAEKIKQDTGIKVYGLKRTYARSAKASGTPVWIGKIEGSIIEVGSIYTATELLKAEKLKKVSGWSCGEIEIEP